MLTCHEQERGHACLRFGYVLLLFGLVLSACHKPDDPTAGVVSGTLHPTEENLLQETDHVIDSSEEATVEEGHLGQLAHRVLGANAIASVGVEEGTIYEMFGNVADAALDTEGRMYVLDALHHEIRIYDNDGRFLRAFGQPGQGPDEFEAPIAMARAHQGELVVVDRNRHVKVFEPQDTTYTLESVIPLDYNPDDVCILNGQIHVAGFRTDEAGTDAMVHVYTLAGEHQRSFGEPYKDINTNVRSRMSLDSSIACSEATQTVQFMFERVPVIFGYSAEGALAWKTKVAPFKPIQASTRITERGTVAFRHHKIEPGTTVARHITALPQGFVLVQIVEFRMHRSIEHSYLLSSTDGHGMYLGPKLSRIFASRPGYLLGGISEPFPQVKLLHSQPLSL